MSDLILYNYKLSPFSEKIRAMLGYAGLSWQSVTVMPMPPRPELEILTGGYRKIPVAQVGAQVYCDSKSIARLIASKSGKPELAIENCTEAAQIFAHRTDLEFFLAMIAVAGPGLLGAVYRETSLLGTLRFVKDRIGVLKSAAFKPASGSKAKKLVADHVKQVETLLTDDFLFGPNPCAADFSAYHCYWFLIDQAGKNVLADAPRARAWFAKMRAFGHGQRTDISAEVALDAARDDEPAEAGASSSDKVSIAPSDYARDPVIGRLVDEQPHSWVIARTHARVGTVHVHFAKSGFALQR